MTDAKYSSEQAKEMGDCPVIAMSAITGLTAATESRRIGFVI
jgi:hypothetical protein